ncbi:ABC transporter permease family protein [Bacillus toyonensis]|uniref:AzlC family ABC transporter permease n=1 Tax=Bacillus toyonensis TaxID=155322 RepID=UPI0011A8C995|nr:AzlC family ABC transporter permease [Bacillus toyonensis]
MDLKNWFSNNKWICLVVVYVVAIFFQYKANGIGFIKTSAGIGLVVALLTTILTNARSVKRFIRKIKFFLGFGMLKWDADATFAVRYKDFKTIKAEEENIRNLLFKALKDNGVENERLEPSYGGQNLKILIEKYVISLDFSFSDAEMTDDEDFALGWVKIRTLASLRYKESNKAIHEILMDFYRYFEQKYNPTEQKFTVSIQPENFEKNFMKKQFINEYTPDEITKFNITCANPRAIESVNEKNISFVTDRREELQNMVKNATLRLS